MYMCPEMIDTLSGIKYEETTKHTHIRITGIIGKKILRVFKIGGISSYYIYLPPSAAIFRNEGLHEEEFCVIEHENKFTNQCSAGLQKTASYGSSSLSIDTTLKTRDAFVRRKAVAVLM
jgi:hypothetical protein